MHLSVRPSVRPAVRLAGRRRWPASLLVVAVATQLLSTTLQVAAHGSEPERPELPDHPASRHQVTLVTGDVVTVTTLADGRQVADVERPSGGLGGVRMQ